MSNSRPFMDFLREHRQGITHDELSDALQELVAKVCEESKAGELVLTIKVKPSGRDSGAVEVGFDTKIRPPKATPGTSIFFVTPDNNLCRTDPRQAALELREIKTPAAAAKGII